MTSPLTCFHPSNLLTYVSLLAGVAAIALASHGSLAGAGALVALSVVADTFDGAFARLFERDARQRAFGAQLDSLSDAAAFGIVPAACMAAAAPPAAPMGLETAWWLAAFLYAACAITRLGYYNLSHDDVPGFVGLPAPVAALIWSSTLLLQPGWGLSLAVFVATGVAMVAPLRLPRPTGLGLAAFALWPIVVGVAHVSEIL